MLGYTVKLAAAISIFLSVLISFTFHLKHNNLCCRNSVVKLPESFVYSDVAKLSQAVTKVLPE